MEIALRLRPFFEQKRLKHLRISLNNVIQRTAVPTGISKNLICKASTLEDVKHWKRKPDTPVNVQQATHVPENFPFVIDHVVREIYLEGARVPTLDIIIDKLLQKRVQNFEHLNLFHGRAIPNLSSSSCIWSRTSLYRS